MSTDNKVVLPKKAKGARPYFFEDANQDKLLAMLMGLVGEVSVPAVAVAVSVVAVPIVPVPIVAVSIVALPIVAVPIVAVPIVAVPIVALPIVAVPIVAAVSVSVPPSSPPQPARGAPKANRKNPRVMVLVVMPTCIRPPDPLSGRTRDAGFVRRPGDRRSRTIAGGAGSQRADWPETAEIGQIRETHGARSVGLPLSTIHGRLTARRAGAGSRSPPRSSGPP